MTRFGWPAVALAMFAIAWGGNEFTPLLVMYRNNDGFSAVTVDALLFAYVLGIVPALLIGGPLSDRIGRRPVMLPAPILAAAGSAVLAFGESSAGVLTVGRILSGVALGLSMAVGGSWLKELDPAGPGARRAAMSLTAGFGIGAGVAGLLAQWGPWPGTTPYLLNIVISLVAAVAIMPVPETRARAANPGRLVDDLKIPAAGNRRFMFVVVPLAPWVFGAAASAYAIIPALMAARVTNAPIAFSALLCVVTLGFGFGIQSVARKIDSPNGVRAVALSLSLLVVGMIVAALAAARLEIWLSLVAAAVLGCGYGMALVSGLQEVQRIAGPDDLAGLTAVFYSVTYLGFAVPAILAFLSQSIGSLTYPIMFGAGAVFAALSLAVALAGHRRHRPAQHVREAVGSGV